MIPSTSTRVSGMEVQSTEYGSKWKCGMCQKRLELFRAKVKSSKQDKLSMSSSLIFRMWKHTWHRELEYSRRLKSGMHKEQRQYSEGTNGRNMGGYVTDHNTTRTHETIRHSKNESLNEVIGGRVKGSAQNVVQEFQRVLESWKCMEAHKDVIIQANKWGTSLLAKTQLCKKMREWLWNHSALSTTTMLL